MKNILCPFDFSEHSKKSLNWLLKNNKVMQAKITIAYVLNNPIYYDAGNPMYGIQLYSDQILTKIREKDTLELKKIVSQMEKKYPDMKINSVFVENDDIANAIIGIAKKIKADLIVMGSHGRRGIRRLLIGSVTEDILKLSKIPVTIVK